MFLSLCWFCFKFLQLGFHLVSGWHCSLFCNCCYSQKNDFNKSWQDQALVVSQKFQVQYVWNSNRIQRRKQFEICSWKSAHAEGRPPTQKLIVEDDCGKGGCHGQPPAHTGLPRNSQELRCNQSPEDTEREEDKFQWVTEVKVARVVSDSLRPVACQAPPSMGFSRQEHWSGWPFPSPDDLPNPGIKPGSLTLQADSLPSEPPEKP